MREDVMRTLGAYRDPETGRKLPSTAQELYLAIWSTMEVEADGERTADPAQSYLAKLIGCHERTVPRSIAALVRAGVLKRRFIPGPDARYTRVPTTYVLPIRRMAPLRTAWRRPPVSRQQKRAEASAAASNAGAIRRHVEPSALAAPVLQALARSAAAAALPVAGGRGIAGSSMDGRVPFLALEARERTPRAVPDPAGTGGRTPPNSPPRPDPERTRGSPPADSPPFDVAAWTLKLSTARATGRTKNATRS